MSDEAVKLPENLENCHLDKDESDECQVSSSGLSRIRKAALTLNRREAESDEENKQGSRCEEFSNAGTNQPSRKRKQEDFINLECPNKFGRVLDTNEIFGKYVENRLKRISDTDILVNVKYQIQTLLTSALVKDDVSGASTSWEYSDGSSSSLDLETVRNSFSGRPVNDSEIYTSDEDDMNEIPKRELNIIEEESQSGGDVEDVGHQELMGNGNNHVMESGEDFGRNFVEEPIEDEDNEKQYE